MRNLHNIQSYTDLQKAYIWYFGGDYASGWNIDKLRIREGLVEFIERGSVDWVSLMNKYGNDKYIMKRWYEYDSPTPNYEKVIK